MRYLILGLVLQLILTWGSAQADAEQIDDYHWRGVDRIVAVGDLHGDFDHYLATLEAAGVVDRKGKWIGGETHLVQTGDVPDRGPDTRRIFEHLDKLAKQAERKGGRVHSLIGNHEAMNVYGDLRYVSAGEYEAFENRNSEKLRDRYYELYLGAMEKQQPERFAALPENYRQTWNEEHPLGWVEHRQAWDFAWNAEPEYGERVLNSKVAIQINDSIFLHGGLSGFYCRNSLESLTEMAHAALRNFDPENPGIIDDPYGPLWYRGLSGVPPLAAPESVDAILAQHDARRIVVGHTPTNGVIWPQYGGKVVMIDTGISNAYGGHVAWLEITPEGAFAGYPGGKLPLPSGEAAELAYLERVIQLSPGNLYLARRLEQLRQPPQPQAEAATAKASEEAGQAAAEDSGGATAAEPGERPVEVPICGIVQ
jgi:hypothetical protein